MKRTILALAFVATTLGAFAQTPTTATTATTATTQKPAVHKTKHKKAEVKKAEAPATPKADKKKSGK